MAENEEVIDNKEEQESEVDKANIKEASGQGWVPKEKFRGKEEDWVDAETFVKRGREILPILRKNNENLLKELNHTKESLKEFRQTAEEFKKFQKESYQKKASDLEAQIVQLKVARSQAITDGDGQRVTAMDDVIDGLKVEAKEARDNAKIETRTTVAQPTVDPRLQEWLNNNEWFGKESRITKMANSIGEDLREKNPGLMGDAFLAKLDEALAEEFPERFGANKGEKRTPNYQTESGANRGRSVGSGKKSYANLPDDAKAACDRYIKQGLMKTREEYVQEYDWS